MGSYDAPHTLLVWWGGKYLLVIPLPSRYIWCLDLRSGFFKYDHLATLIVLVCLFDERLFVSLRLPLLVQ